MLLNKRKTKIGPKAKSKSVPKLKESGEKNTESVVESNKPDKEEQKDTGEGESVSEKMFVLRKQVEVMIAEGKSVDESETKIETLKNILAMLQASRGSSKVDENIRKKDENTETSEKTDKAIAVAKKGETMHQDTKDNTDSINVINKYEKVILKMDVESSDEFNSDESVQENIKSIITNLDDRVGVGKPKRSYHRNGRFKSSSKWWEKLFFMQCCHL